jgi:hypothetical protein
MAQIPRIGGKGVARTVGDGGGHRRKIGRVFCFAQGANGSDPSPRRGGKGAEGNGPQMAQILEIGLRGRGRNGVRRGAASPSGSPSTGGDR